MAGYRKTDVSTPKSVRAIVGKLMDTVPAELVGVFTNLLIELMRSSAQWDLYVRKYDPVNTYQSKANADILSLELCGISWDSIVEWADSVYVQSEDFTLNSKDTKIDRVCNALLSVASVDV